jgi:hypothetical protein
MLYHAYELEPGENNIFESHIPTKKYYKEIGDRLHSIEKMLHSS